MSEVLDRILNFVLGNVGIVVFAIFLLSGLLGRGNKKKPQPQEQRSETRQQEQVDDRPLAERLAEAFGVEVPTENKPPQREPSRPPTYASEGRRSTTTGNVQDQYPGLFGGPGMFDSSRSGTREKEQWGFDEAEWGSTFEKSEEQWGNTFPEKKSSEPRIEWPS